ncbi:MAG TPA: CHAP domain-containing protein [Polyangia bacterium]
MRLLLPGERHFSWLEVGLAIVVVLGLCALGCAAPRAHTRGLAPSLFQAARYEARHPTPRGRQDRDEGAAFVERALHDAGFRFGTDGTPGALWGYLRTSHRMVGAAAVRAGDIVFFDTQGTGPAPACADRTGIVERVSPGGRIDFVEARGGRIHREYVDPAHPRDRRGAGGEVLNSFLRPIRIDDPPGTRYFAGEMLCGIARAF